MRYEKSESERILLRLQELICDAVINFDLDDFDNILRVKSERDDATLVEAILQSFGHVIKALD